jgi:hypothetical protein
VENVADKSKAIAAHVHTLKTKGCKAVPVEARKLLVALIKSRIEKYPENGICNPDWVRDVLIDKLDLLESATAIQDRFDPMGYTAHSGNRQLDKPDISGLSLGSVATNSDSAKWLSNRFSINTQDSSFVYAPSFKAHQSGGVDSRLHLHQSLQVVHQEGSRSDYSRSDGMCGVTSSTVETQCGVFSGTNWWKG